jgi:hypothetical protein
MAQMHRSIEEFAIFCYNNGIPMRLGKPSFFGSHRTLVALPVMAVVCVLSLRGAVSRHAQVLPEALPIQVGQTPASFTLDHGMTVIGLPGASFQLARVPYIENGEVLVAARGMSHVNAGNVHMQGWRGAFSVVNDADSLTVVALTTPVLVAQNAERFLIPMGSQARLTSPLAPLEEGADAWIASRHFLPLPVHYLQERLDMVKDSAMAQKSRSSSEVIALPNFVDALRTDAAMERAIEEEDEALRAQLMTALEQADAQAIHTLLLAKDAERMLRTTDADTLATMASMAIESDTLSLFLPSLLKNEDMLLLASVHPLLRDGSWMLGATELSPSSRLSRIAMFPSANLSSRAASQLATDRWRDEVSSVLKEQGEHAPALLQALLPYWADALQKQVALGLPERVQRSATALQSLATPYRDALNAESQELLSSLLALPNKLMDVRLEASSVNTQSASSAASIASHSSAATADADTMIEALLKAGGMRVPQTFVRPLSATTLQVRDMLFATPNGDKPFAFTFDAAKGEILNVIIEGKTLPYAVELQKFVEWIKTTGGQPKQ